MRDMRAHTFVTRRGAELARVQAVQQRWMAPRHCVRGLSFVGRFAMRREKHSKKRHTEHDLEVSRLPTAQRPHTKKRA